MVLLKYLGFQILKLIINRLLIKIIIILMLKVLYKINQRWLAELENINRLELNNNRMLMYRVHLLIYNA